MIWASVSLLDAAVAAPLVVVVTTTKLLLLWRFLNDPGSVWRDSKLRRSNADDNVDVAGANCIASVELI